MTTSERAFNAGECLYKNLIVEKNLEIASLKSDIVCFDKAIDGLLSERDKQDHDVAEKDEEILGLKAGLATEQALHRRASDTIGLLSKGLEEAEQKVANMTAKATAWERDYDLMKVDRNLWKASYHIMCDFSVKSNVTE